MAGGEEEEDEKPKCNFGWSASVCLHYGDALSNCTVLLHLLTLSASASSTKVELKCAAFLCPCDTLKPRTRWTTTS